MRTELFEILTDPPHLVAEFIFESMSVMASVAYTKIRLRQRDKVHGHDDDA